MRTNWNNQAAKSSLSHRGAERKQRYVQSRQPPVTYHRETRGILVRNRMPRTYICSGAEGPSFQLPPIRPHEKQQLPDTAQFVTADSLPGQSWCSTSYSDPKPGESCCCGASPFLFTGGSNGSNALSYTRVLAECSQSVQSGGKGRGDWGTERSRIFIYTCIPGVHRVQETYFVLLPKSVIHQLAHKASNQLFESAMLPDIKRIRNGSPMQVCLGCQSG